MAWSNSVTDDLIQEQARTDEAAAIARAQSAAQAETRRLESLRDSAPEAIADARAELAAAREAVAAGEHRGALSALARSEASVAPLRELSPAPEGLVSVLGEQGELAQQLQPVRAAIAAIDNASSVLDAQHNDAVAEHDAVTGALASLDGLSEDAARPFDPEVRGLRRRLQRSERTVRREAARIREARIRREAVLAVCGREPPRRTELHALVFARAAQSAHDPDSISVESCGQPELDDDACWVTQCRVRGNNAFGGRVLDVYEVGFSPSRGFTRFRRL